MQSLTSQMIDGVFPTKAKAVGELSKNARDWCVPCNGAGWRYIRHETGYASKATETCSSCSGNGFTNKPAAP
jgi:DnaJ-class molecular chaperone